MGRLNWKSALAISGLLLLGVGFLLLVIGISTPHWVESDDHRNGDYGMGLFQECTGDSCKDIDVGTMSSIALIEIPSALASVRACCIVGVILSGIALVLLVIKICKIIPQHSKLGIVGAVLCFGAGFFMMTGILIFDVKVYKGCYDVYMPRGRSFYLCVVGLVFTVVGGLTTLIFDKRHAPDYPPPSSTFRHIFTLSALVEHTESQDIANNQQQQEQQGPPQHQPEQPQDEQERIRGQQEQELLHLQQKKERLRLRQQQLRHQEELLRQQEEQLRQQEDLLRQEQEEQSLHDQSYHNEGSPTDPSSQPTVPPAPSLTLHPQPPPYEPGGQYPTEDPPPYEP